MSKKGIVIIGLIITVVLLTLVVINVFLKNKITTSEYKNDNYKIVYDSTWEVVENEKYLELKHKKTNSILKIQSKELDDAYIDTRLSLLIDDIMDSIIDQNTGYNLINYSKNDDRYDSYSYLYEKDDEQVLVNIYKKDRVLIIMYYSAQSDYFDIVLDSVDTMIDTLEIFVGEK